MPDRTWAIIVHGGAKDIAPDQQETHRQGCLEAVTAGQAVLEAGGPAIAAVEAAVRVLEDDPIFNAGYGSVLNAKGEVECDAAIMDGATLAVGGVAAVRTLRHPISVAASMLPEKPVLLVAEGAEAFASVARRRVLRARRSGSSRGLAIRAATRSAAWPSTWTAIWRPAPPRAA
jgi:beta-aspartyl-peptidase (threonine type)